ncbi:endolytic transglycosylase MltG, partial [Acidobacteriota bacterium]
MKLKIIKRFFLLAAVLVLFLSCWFAVEFLITPKKPSGKIQYEIERGEGANSLAEHLKTEGIIPNKWAFLLGHSLFYSQKTIKAGEYIFELPLSIQKILRIVTEGKSLLHAATIPEGLTRMEIAGHLESLGIAERQAFMKASEDTSPISSIDLDARDLEGYLFPETYYFPKGVTSERIVSSMTDQFMDTFIGRWEKK